MSLEASIQDLTEAVKAQTALMQTMAKSAPAAAKAEPAKKAPAKKAPAKKTTKPRAPTPEDVVEAYGTFLKAADNKTDRNKLVGAVKPVCEHFGIERISEIDPDNCAEALEYANLLQAGYDEGGVDGALEVVLPFSADDVTEGGDDDDDDGEDLI